MSRYAVWVFAVSLSLWSMDSTRGDPTVGVYYYPWWGENIGGHTFDQTLRAHTSPQTQLPSVGEYSSRDADVIGSHIDQSLQGNISMWSMSWWGPNGFEDITIRDHILTHPRASQLSYTIHYESSGRLGSFNSPNYSKLIPDFQHLATHVFNDPNYMRIDGRPVVVMYLSRVYFDDPAGAAALDDLRTAMQQQFGYDPYIIGDHVFGSVAAGASNLDAITGFDVYGQAFGDGVVNESKIDRLEHIYAIAEHIADLSGVDFIPGLAPGYNDKAVRSGHDPAARYLAETGIGSPGSAMAAMLEDAVLPHTDVDINELILVNSFNEWHEDTQIEASVSGPFTNADDTSSGSGLTAGRYYEGYGSLYLDILRNATFTVSADFDNNGVVDGDDFLIWQSNFGSPAPTGGDADGDRDVDGDDFLIWQSHYGSGGSAVAAVPEPSSCALAASLLLPWLLFNGSVWQPKCPNWRR